MPGYYDIRVSVDAHAIKLTNATDHGIVLAHADLEAIRQDPECWRRLCGAVVAAITQRLAGGE